MLKHVPNILTLVRFILIAPIVIAIANEEFIIAVMILTISGITDVLDGWIARKFGFITDFGKLMDPFADKATQIAILVTLAVKGIIPFWVLAVVVIKEFAMISRSIIPLWKRACCIKQMVWETCNSHILYSYCMFTSNQISK